LPKNKDAYDAGRKTAGLPAHGAYNERRADGIAGMLAAVLEQEALLYQDAADISAKKTDVIVHGKIEELDSLVKAEQAIILKIGKLEDEREKIVETLSDELELDLEGVTLSDINTRLGGECYARLDNCHKSLAGAIDRLKNHNDMNAQLIQHALDYVNFSVNLLTTNQNTGSLYSQDGGDDAGNQRRSVFDVKL
jgi:flagellar biosynthesis/type III secretory pathway chaperone